jgi:alanyl-tRNA synthetase
VDRAGLAALGVRKDSARNSDIRVIDVEGFDRSPCGGTHVRRTGEIGLIAVLGFERYKGGTRVEFACGGRALATLRNDHEVLRTLGRLVSGHPYELPRLTEKLIDERSALARENSRLQDQILETEAAELLRKTAPGSGRSVVRARFSDRGLETVKLLAQKICARPGSVAILAVVQESAQIVVAKSGDIAGDCGAAVKEAAKRLGGRGGGRPELAQAGGIPLSALEEWVQSVENSVVPQP